jgi:DNA-binding cell septation regulator SpoVG
MPDTLRLSNVRFARATPALRSSGLLGWATLTLNDGLEAGYIAVRRTLDGRIVLAFPERTDLTGITRPIVRPIDQSVRDAITRRVVAELRRMEVLP